MPGGFAIDIPTFGVMSTSFYKTSVKFLSLDAYSQLDILGEGRDD